MQPKHKTKAPLPDTRGPSEIMQLVRRDVIDLTGVSKFFERQAEFAALFTDGIEQRAPGHFVLKSPFRENFIGSFHIYIYPEAPFSPAETIAYALRRHVELYLRSCDTHRISSRFYAELNPLTKLEPAALRARGDPTHWWQGFIGVDGKFAINPEKQGTPAVLVFQEISGENMSLALEIRGPDVGTRDPAFRRTLLKSVLKEALLQLGLEQSRPGRPHHAQRAEGIAYNRDHKRLTKQKIAAQFCDCGEQ